MSKGLAWILFLSSAAGFFVQFYRQQIAVAGDWAHLEPAAQVHAEQTVSETASIAEW